MYYHVTAPVKPYILEFLSSKYGLPVNASKNNVVGLVIEPFLEKTPEHPRFPSYTCSVDIKLSWTGHKEGYKDQRVHNYLSEINARQFSKAIEKVFWDLFFEHMDSITDRTDEFQIKDLIFSFRDKYEISPDAGSYEMFKKQYYRYRKSFGDSSSLNKAS